LDYIFCARRLFANVSFEFSQVKWQSIWTWSIELDPGQLGYTNWEPDNWDVTD